MNGAFYLIHSETFMRTRRIYGSPRSYGIEMDRWHSLEIETPEDLEDARRAAAIGLVNMREWS